MKSLVKILETSNRKIPWFERAIDAAKVALP
jgi:hypothetical protein